MNCFLFLSGGPPSPGRVIVLKQESNSVVLSWRKPACDGGHFLQSYNLRFGTFDFFFIYPFFYNYIYVYNISASAANYTLKGLVSRTTYTVSVQAVGVDDTRSSYTPSVSFVTKAPGIMLVVFNSCILNAYTII